MTDAPWPSQGIAYVGEDTEAVTPVRVAGRLHSFMHTGTFSVHWKPHADGAGIVEGREGVTATEAIAWARQRRACVLVRRAGDEHYFSAGNLQPPGEAFPQWPGRSAELGARLDLRHGAPPYSGPMPAR